MLGWEYGGKGQNMHGHLLWSLSLAASYIQINKGMQQIRDGHGNPVGMAIIQFWNGNGKEWERP